MTLKLVTASLCFTFVAACGGSTPAPAGPTTDDKTAGIANPASVYCGEIGGELTMVEGEGGTSGVCKKDGAECDEWALYRGECPEMAPASPKAGRTDDTLEGSADVVTPEN